MQFTISMIDGALSPGIAAASMSPEGAGALIVFEGIVRGHEAGEPVSGLFYTAYEPMAQRQLELLAQDVLRKHRLLAVRVEHSRGFVGVGEISFRLLIASPHRKEGIAAMDEFIDRMKQDVPIWKEAVRMHAAGGAQGAAGPPQG
jgi:molybdopterin synthase catalytic subunit